MLSPIDGITMACEAKERAAVECSARTFEVAAVRAAQLRDVQEEGVADVSVAKMAVRSYNYDTRRSE
jgi:hypothetical protein